MKPLTFLETLPSEDALGARPRPYENHVVRFKAPVSRAERASALQDLGLNVFWYPASMVTGCDLLSDSGTTAMTHEQWAALHEGDEAYGANRGYFMLKEQVRQTFGPAFWSDDAQIEPNAFIYHQGRTAERALFSQLGRKRPGGVVLSNGHFDTTRANVVTEGLSAIDLFCPELVAKDPEAPFKGNVDLDALARELEQRSGSVVLVLLTITNNTGGGQPVSMANIRAAAELAHAHGVPLFFDACRFAENAWLLRESESGRAQAVMSELVREMFSHVDGFTVSFKKDGLANMGGGLFVREGGLFHQLHGDVLRALVDDQVRTEGHPSYGGLSGRDLMALVVGLRRVTDPAYLSHRIGQVRTLGEELRRRDLPIVTPVGGHAVYLEVDEFFRGTQMRPGDFGGVALSALLLAGFGHRTGEVGAFNFGIYDPDTGEERLPPFNYLRFAVPRLRYEAEDLRAVAEAMRVLHEARSRIPAVDVVHGRELPLRYFKARLRFREGSGT